MNNEIIKGIGQLGRRERSEAIKLMVALDEGKYTALVENYFDFDNWDVYMNPNSGFVFLCDEEYNTVMMNGDKVDLFLNTPYHGCEGFFDELMEYDFLEMHPEDQDYMISMATDEMKEKWPLLKDGAFIRFGGKD